MKYLVSIIAMTAGFAATAHAAQPPQNFPARPLRMIVAFTAGSETDFFARLVAQKMSENWGQQVVVDNRPGAGGTLAGAIAAGAATDGHTLFMNSMAHAVTPAIYARLPYDSLRDFAGVSQVAGVPNVLVVAPAQGIRSVKELIALAKQKPGQLTFSSAGIGSGMHINGEQFRLAADISVIHVPYKGGPEALTDTMTSRVNYVFSPIGLALPMIKDRRVVALAVSTARRAPALPEVPTVAEAGVPGFEFDTWYGLFAPAKTQRPIINKLSAEVARILNLPDTRERMATRGGVPKPSKPEEFDRFVREEAAKLGKVVSVAGIKAN